MTQIDQKALEAAVATYCKTGEGDLPSHRCRDIITAYLSALPPPAGEVGELVKRLWRVPYLVLPKLAIQAMPLEWRNRLEALLEEADATGMVTPDYHVFRDDPKYTAVELSDPEDEYSAIASLTVRWQDEWANYRHGRVEDVCPTFTPTPERT
jgi:hypothetical protein